MSILLRLREHQVRTVTEGKGKTIVEVRTKEGGCRCPYCSLESLCPHGNGKRRTVPHTGDLQFASGCRRY